jgi:hypothetical protein
MANAIACTSQQLVCNAAVLACPLALRRDEQERWDFQRTGQVLPHPSAKAETLDTSNTPQALGGS